jgi:predicted aminopeptidase
VVTAVSRKKKILLAILLLLGVFAAINHRWVVYVGHLAKHQFRVVFYKEKISDRLKRPNLSDEERRTLNMTLSIRRFAELSYGLTNSTSYQSYYDLGRKELGYNITVAPALSLKPESFRFWPIGSFDYLGFFDQVYAQAWADEYRKKGFDVHLAEIGGYSTLGWFEDPLYSSQLSWGEYGLARLLAHEIAHEKLYFKDDTTFSELLASFIEVKVAREYLVSVGRPAADSQIAEKRRRREELNTALLELRTNLENLYASRATNEEKLRQKEKLIADFNNMLKGRAEYFGIKVFTEINNAFLAQFHRYTPQGKAFEGLFENCRKTAPKDIYGCWFGGLTKLKPCTREARKAWLSGDGKTDAACGA